MDGPFTFTSRCPRCGHERSQDDFDRRSLRRSLALGHLIEGYCAACDDLWPISAEERGVLAQALASDTMRAPTAEVPQIRPMSRNDEHERGTAGRRSPKH
jgi:hypothetical protein